MYDLYRIRLDDLLQVSARENSVLVGVWVTNHSKCRRFVREKLLPSWGVGNIVDWYWVKITSGEDGTDKNAGGLPVWSFNGPSPRRCYEGLMLGYYNPYHLKMGKELAPNRAFISVPLEHSRKPLVIGECRLKFRKDITLSDTYAYRPPKTVPMWPVDESPRAFRQIYPLWNKERRQRRELLDERRK